MIVSAAAALIALSSPQAITSPPLPSMPRNDIAFDADPTGVKDSTDILQHLIDTKHSFYLFPGRYRLRKPLILRDDTRISADGGTSGGIGETASLFADPANTGSGGGLLLIGRSVRNVVVDDIIFDGQASPATPLPSNTTRLVYIDGGTNVVFTGDAWRNSNGSALVFSGISGPVADSGVRESKFSNLGFGWRPPGLGALNETAPVIVFANGLPAGNHGNFVSGNQITNVGSDAISVQQQSHFVAEHNRLDLGQAGWRPSSPATAVTYGVGGFYVFQTRDTAPNQNVVLRDNIVRGATGNCYDLTSTDQLEVIDNVASSCGGAGVALGNDVSYFTVVNNTLTHNFQSASYAYPNLSHRGSLSFGCGRQPCTATIRDGKVDHNIFADGGRPSQPIDAWQEAGVALINVQTDVTVVREGAPQPVRSPRPTAGVSAPPAQLTPEETRALSAWRAVMDTRPPPNDGCATAAYPSLEWHRVRCGPALNVPFSPTGPAVRPRAQ